MRERQASGKARMGEKTRRLSRLLVTTVRRCGIVVVAVVLYNFVPNVNYSETATADVRNGYLGFHSLSVQLTTNNHQDDAILSLCWGRAELRSGVPRMHLCSLDVWNAKQGWRDEKAGLDQSEGPVCDDRPG